MLMYCNKHNIKKDYLLCLDQDCADKLGCIECCVVDK